MAKKGYVLLDDTGVDPTICLDEDNMASDSATALATQQSIKAYVDASAGGASFGLVDQIPHTNVTVDDFDYSANFAYTGDVLTLKSSTATNSVVIGFNAGGGGSGADYNTILGVDAGTSISTGDRNTFIGESAGNATSNGSYNTFIGMEAGALVSSTANYNVGIGYQAMEGGVGTDNCVAIGKQAAESRAQHSTIAIGFEAARTFVTGLAPIAIGYQALEAGGGDYVIAIGYNAATLATTATNGIFMGYQAGYRVTGTGNIGIGYNALGYTSLDVTGNYNVVIGWNAATTLRTNSNNVAIGASAMVNNSTSDNCVYVGTSSGSSATCESSTAVGWNSANNADGDYCVYIGYQAGKDSTLHDNVFIGRDSGLSNDGSNNVYIGSHTGDATTGSSDSVLIGYNAGTALTSGDNHVIIGSGAGAAMTTNGSCVFIGYQAGASETAANKLYIENSNSASPLIWGDFNTDDVKINGTFEVTEGMINNITTSAAGAYAVLVTDFIILKTGITGGGDTVTLPSTAATGQRFFIKDAAGTAGTNNITVATAGAENIDGNATIVLNADDDGVQVVFDGSNYFVIGRV